MSSVRQARDALKDAVTAGTGMPGSAVDGPKVNAGSFQVVRGEFDPRLVFGQPTAVYPFKIRVFASTTATDGSIRALDDYADPRHPQSVIAAVQDETLWPDDLVHYAQVVRVGEVTLADFGAEQYLMVEFDVEVVW